MAIRAMKKTRGIGRAFTTARYSCRGIAAAWKKEESFRQEVVLAAVMAPFAFVIGEGFAERSLLLGSLLLVLLVELINSAIEATNDRVGKEHHELSARAKDLGSAAVMIALILAGSLWGIKTLIFMGLL